MNELMESIESLRAAVAQRADYRDIERLRRQTLRQASRALDRASRYAGSVRDGVAVRVRPAPRRRFPLVPVLIVGVAAVGIAVLLADRRRREAVQGQVGRASAMARQRYAELGGVGGAVDKVRHRVSSTGSVALDQAALEARVRDAVSAVGSGPAGLKVTVEGRTVYLRGAVEDAAEVDAAAERVHAVDGVVAVVNLTTSPAHAPVAAPNGGA